MPLQDWAVLDTIRATRRSYRAAGVSLVGVYQHHFEISFGNLGAGATATMQTITVPPDADFLWLGNVMTPHGDQAPIGSSHAGHVAIIRIERLATRQRYARHSDIGRAPDGWVAPTCIAGRARCPFIWPAPILLKASETVTFEAINRGNAALTPFRFGLLGVLFVVGMRRAA